MTWDAATGLAVHHRELYEAYRRSGFGERQALYLVAARGEGLTAPDSDGDEPDDDPDGPDGIGDD